VRHSPEDPQQIIPISELRQSSLQKRIREYIAKAELKRNPDGMILTGNLFRKEFQPVWKIAELPRQPAESEEASPSAKVYLLTDSSGHLYVQTWDSNMAKRPKREVYDRQKHGDLDRWIDVGEFRAMEQKIGMLKIRKKRSRK
jgi:hypothetical protein